MIDLKRLKSFLVVVEEGHLGRAAKQLHLSQPALSRRIQELERQLEFALFEHVGRSLRLTGQGQGFLIDCRELLTHAEAVEERARSFASGENGVLGVGATPQMLERLLPELLIRYRSAFPLVEVKLSEGTSQDSLNRLERGEIDLALIPPQRFEWLDSRTLPALEIYAVAPRGRWPEGVSHIELNEISDQPMLLLSRGYKSRQEFDTACQLAHIKPRIILESSAPQTILALAEADLGIAIVPSTVQINSHKLHPVPLAQDGLPLDIQVTISWHRHRYLAPYAKQFIEVLSEIAQKQLTTQIVA